MSKKIWLSICLLILGFISLQTFANSFEELRFDDWLFTWYFASIQNNQSDINFKYNWNNFWWIFLLKWLQQLSTWEVVELSWSNKVCTHRLSWIYYNSQRWNRIRPLDTQSLSWLKLLDASYDNLSIQWWLFVGCETWSLSNKVYWNITHIYGGNQFELIVGVDYDFGSNKYFNTYSGSLNYFSWKLFWYIWDNYGWIWRLLNSTIYQWASQLSGTTISGSNTTLLPHEQTTIYSGSNNYLLISWSQIVVSGWNRDWFIVPPTPVSWIWTSNPSGVWLSTGDMKFSIQAGATWASLHSSGGIFVINFFVSDGYSWQQLLLYRSQDWNARAVNNPDSTCILSNDKNCQFKTDHLSFFVGMYDQDDDYVQPISNPSRWGWGWTRLVKDNCLYSASSTNNLPWANQSWKDYSPSYYDKTCVQNPSDTQHFAGECNVTGSPYSQELNSAFQYNYNLWTTTVCPWSEARLDKYILRKELAKMMSIYANKTMWKQPQNISACNDFTDIENESKEMKTYIKFACQLNLMWYQKDWKTVNDKFNPNSFVTRAEYATVFSRLLYGDKYDNSKWKRYSDHLNALKKNWIMNQIDDPFMSEIRWYIMIMLWRHDTSNND